MATYPQHTKEGAPKLAAIVQGTGTSKPVTTTNPNITDLKVSEIASAFVVALNQLNLLTERINKLCDKMNHELDKQPNQH